MGIIIVVGTIIIIIAFFEKNRNKPNVIENTSITNLEMILLEKVAYYNALSTDDKKIFQKKVIEFLDDVTITGIEVSIDETDKVLVASSAIIPIFGFHDWKYRNINEVLLYPSSFNENFETKGKDRRILGMVGEGAMNGTMILSKPALINGFLNETDKNNTAIHEFVHLIDKSDGDIDGIPEQLLGKEYTIPWINLMAEKITQINQNQSDINPYGATNKAEFFAVASEYFFERPQLLQKKHPVLYDLLEQIFKQRMSEKKLERIKKRIGRNDLCYCDTGLKYKNCCGALRINNKN